MWPIFSALEPFESLDANWRETLRSQRCSVVFWWAVWSTPDKMFASVIARVVPDYTDRFAFFTAHVEEESLIPMFTELPIYTTPTLVMFENDVEVKRTIGSVKEDALRSLFDAWLQE